MRYSSARDGPDRARAWAWPAQPGEDGPPPAFGVDAEELSAWSPFGTEDGAGSPTNGTPGGTAGPAAGAIRPRLSWAPRSQPADDAPPAWDSSSFRSRADDVDDVASSGPRTWDPNNTGQHRRSSSRTGSHRRPSDEPDPPAWDPNGTGPHLRDPDGSGPRAWDPNGTGPHLRDPDGSGPRAWDPNGTGPHSWGSNGTAHGSQSVNGSGAHPRDVAGSGPHSWDPTDTGSHPRRVNGTNLRDPHGGGQRPAGPARSGPPAWDPNGSGQHAWDPDGSGPHAADPHGSGPHPSWDAPGSGPHAWDPQQGSGPHPSRDPQGSGPHSRDPKGSGPPSWDPQGSGPHSWDPHGSGPHATGPASAEPSWEPAGPAAGSGSWPAVPSADIDSDTGRLRRARHSRDGAPAGPTGPGPGQVPGDYAAAAGLPAPGQPGLGQPGPGQFGAGQFGPGQSGAGQFGPGQSGPGQSGPGQFGPGQPGPGQFGSGSPDGPPAAEGRRTTVVLRYLLARLAVDHVRRLTRWALLLALVGLVVVLLVEPPWIGAVGILLGAALIVGRIVAVRRLEQVALADQFRAVEDDLRGAVEAGKASLRVELRRVGLPSRSWHLPVFALRLARGTVRVQAKSKLRAVDVDRVLPRAQLDRALRLLDTTTAGR